MGPKKQQIKLTGEMTSSGSLSVKMRSQLEINMYRLAVEHAVEACKSHKMATEDANIELDHSLRAIILAAACLEAFINSEGISVYGSEWEGYESGTIRPKGRPNLEVKWFEVTARRTGGPTFCKGRLPYQGLIDLIRSRNYILHYKSPMSPPVSSSIGNVTEARACINLGSARSAVDTMKSMLVKFHELVRADIPTWVT